MTVHIEKLDILAIIGILNFERITPQRVVIDVLIDYSYRESKFINYVEIISIIETMIIDKKYLLLEDALLDIRDMLVDKYPQIINLNLKISKPNIVDNAIVALSLHYSSLEH